MSLATRAEPRPKPSFLARAAPRAARPIPRAAVASALALILGVFAARCLPVARADAITSDEATHLARILNLLRNGDDLAMWELGAPRLPHLIGGMASYLALRPVGMLAEANDFEGVEQVVLSGFPRALVPARLVAIGWGVALIALVYWAAARSMGPMGGLVAAGLTSLVPEVLAHSSIAGSDVPFTASAFLALVLLARYVERPGAARWGAASLAIGLAWAMRHTALLLLILAAGVHLAVALRRPRARGLGPLAEALAGSGLAVAAMGILAFATLWAGDGLGTVPLGEVAGRASASAPTIGGLDLSELPVPTSALSILKQVRHQNAGHEAYFCGETSQTGWPTYFPVAFLLKTPVGLLALMALAAARAVPRRPSAWAAVALAALGLLWFMLVRNKVNIGVRYALLTYPLGMPFVASMFVGARWRDRVWTPLALGCALWFAVASIGAQGRFLSSFNEIGGGPSQGWLYLADSNVDWGQDFDRLGRTIQRLGIREVTTDVSTERRLRIPGVYARPNPSREFQVPAETPKNRRLHDAEGGYLPVYTRYVAVSASRLMGLYSQNDVSWLRTRKLVERVGDSTFLFDMDLPADRPLGELPRR